MKKIFTLLTAILLSVSMYAYYWGDDASYAYSVSNATYTATSISNVRKIQANVNQVGYAGCLDLMTRMFFVVPEECGYVPTGVYNISSGSEPFQQGTVIAGDGYSVHQVSDWCNGGYPDSYADYFSSGTVIVFNPNKTAIPSYILASFTTLKGWTHKVTIGTEPTIRTVTFNDEADGNGNTFEESVNPFCADNECTTFFEGTEFILTPQPASGFVFNSWTGTGAGDITPNGDGTYTLIVGAKDYNISATWTELSGGAITAVASPAAGGSVVVDPTGWQAAGTAVTLTPSANPNYAFIGWQGGGNDNPRTVYVNGDASYTALFAPTHTITVTSANASQGSVSGGGTYAEGASVTISASGLNGYVFSQWKDGNTDNPRTVTMGNTNASYEAQFTLQTMSVGSCSDADISFHLDYGDIFSAGQYNYFAQYGANSYCNNMAVGAQGSNNYAVELYFARNGDSNTKTYNGGDCKNQKGPYPGDYVLWRAVKRKVSGYTYWRCYTGNTLVCYRYDNGEPSIYSQIHDGNGNPIKLRSADAGDGKIIVSTNNVGGLFFETNEYVQNYDQNKSIYFTVGNRSENTVNLGTGTMSVTPSSLIMSGTSGNNSASIKLNSNATGDKTLADFNVSNCSFTYNGNSITEISDMTGTLTASNGTYTLSLKIRDCSQNLYKVTMSAVAPSFNLTWNANGKSVTGGTAAGSVQFGSAITAPSNNTAGYNLTWSPAVPSTMPAQDATYAAQWSAINYNITYNQNDGTGATDGTYTIESNTITLPTASAMTKTGYTFDGWYDNSGLTGNAVTTIPQGSTGNKTFWAKWTAKTYTVNLDNQSATTAGETSVTATYGQAMPSIASNLPEKTGHIFEGYYTQQNGGTKYYNADGTSAHNWDIDTNPTTLFAHWTAIYTITIADYTGGTVTVSYNDGSDQSFTSGSRDIAEYIYITTTAEAAPHYTLTSLTYSGEGSIDSGDEREVDGNHTITAVFTGDSYGITYKDKDNANYSGSNLANLPATHTYGTATTLVNGAKEGYTFLGWFTDEACTESAGSTIGATAKTAAFTLYAKWERNVVKYNVTFAAGEHGSASGKIGGNIITSGQQQEEGSTITLTATPDNFYSFVEWRNASNEQVVSTNAEYSFTLAEAVNLTAVFALQETIELTDNFENGSQWQDDYAALLELLRAGGKTSAPKDVRIIRTFKAGRWSTFSLPFGYSFQKDGNNTFRGQVYYLISAEYKEGGYLTLNCMPNTYRIEANKPYILIPDANIVNPVFENVKLTEIVDNSYSASDKNGSGSVIFRNTQYRQIIYNEESSINKRTIYLSNNRLYYPGTTDMYMNAFRGYFYMDYENIFHSPARIRLMNDMGEQIETLPEGEEETSAEVKKYIENGILVIERGGVKYDAQGHKLN